MKRKRKEKEGKVINAVTRIFIGKKLEKKRKHKNKRELIKRNS